MARPTVSVIIPTFNRLQWLGQALDSVAAQQFADYETVVVDDGSDDGTDQMIAARPEPIRYFWQPNQGAAQARNRGIAEARGRFVAFLDSDDLWLPRYLQACVSLLRQKPDLAMVYCDFACVDADGRPLKGHHKRQYAGDVIEQLFASIFIQTSCVTARRDVIVQAGGFDPRLPTSEDYELWLRLALRYRFGLVPEPLCLRRSHPHSLSRDGLAANLVAKAQMLERFYRHQGGCHRIRADIATRRLAKVYYAAGRAMLRRGQPGQAQHLLRHSLNYRPGTIKVWGLYLASRLISTLSAARNAHSRPARPGQ